MSTNKCVNVEGLNFIDQAYTRAETFRKTSDRYLMLSPLQTIDAISAALSDLDQEHDIDIRPAPGPKTSKLYATFTLLSQPNTHSDTTKPDGYMRILATLSLNGEASTILSAGYFRLVCTNGLMIGTHEEHIRLRHVDNARRDKAAMQLDIIYDAVAEMTQRHTGHVERIAQLQSATTSGYEQEAGIILGMDIPKAAKLRALELRHPDNFATQRPEDQHRNLWILLNVINEQLRETTRSEDNVVMFDQNVSVTSAILAHMRKAA